jgi:hypothetical protein
VLVRWMARCGGLSGTVAFLEAVDPFALFVDILGPYPSRVLAKEVVQVLVGSFFSVRLRVSSGFGDIGGCAYPGTQTSSFKTSSIWSTLSDVKQYSRASRLARVSVHSLGRPPRFVRVVPLLVAGLGCS